jgi:formylglycine-generating enzyme required for sulfatase activity
MRRLDDLCDVYIGTFRLPTEAEWEYACRAGTTTPFHYGEETKPSMVNCWEQAPRDERGRRQKSRSVDVGSFEPNAWGLYDMHGSLWEWCADGYSRYPTNDVVDPCRQGKERVVRGGSWRWPLLGCRSAVRAKRNPGYSHNHHGFRVVASREPTPATRDR